jgi:hypothetical protein
VTYDEVRARTFREWLVVSIEKNRGGPNLIDLEFRKDFTHFRLDPQGGIVAEKNSVCRLAGSSGTMRRSAWMKPRSSIWSASSSTSTLAVSRRTALRSTRSSRRPGVATRTSSPPESRESEGTQTLVLGLGKEGARSGRIGGA